MSGIKTGGPAFPIVPTNISHWEGMTLRDYFAAKAMAAYISRIPFERAYSMREIAQDSYHDADAMLKAREVTA
jgi:hypothetical protein